jgi:hypothetical protein
MRVISQKILHLILLYSIFVSPMRKAFFCLLISWLASFPIAGHTQKSYLALNAVHLPKLIADNNILMAIRDKAGLLWFVTENGLYRYDGTELLHFGIGTAPALPSLSITALCSDNQGNLWIGFKNGAAKFDLKHWSITELYSPNWNSLSAHDKKITAVACLRNDDVYFGTQSGKLFTAKSGNLVEVADLGAGRIKFKPTGPPLEEPAINNIQEPVKNELWLATGDGMLVNITRNPKGFSRPALYKFALNRGIQISNICYDSSGKCLFSVGDRGIFLSDIKALYSEKRLKILRGLNSEFSTIIKPVALPDSLPATDALIFYIPGGKVGLPIVNKGLVRHIYMYDFSADKWVKDAQSYFAKYPGELIHSISSLARGQVAYISSGGGLIAVHSKTLPFEMKLNSENNINSIRAIYADGENIYIGSYQQYLVKFNRVTGKITPLKTLYVYSILPWGKDTLLIGSEGAGLQWYQPSINKITYIGNNFELTQKASVYQSKYITALQRVNSHQILEGTTRGLHLIDPLHKTLKPVFSNPSAQNMQAVKINALAPYPVHGHKLNNEYLVGTEAGAFITNIQNGQTRNLLPDSIAEEIRQSNVHCFLTFNHQIWMGTSGLGMLSVDSTDNFHFMEWLNSKLTGHTIYSMVKVGSHILIGTNKGFNILDLKDSSLVGYQASDGMHSDEFDQSAWFADGQYIYMGTLNGIVMWNKNNGNDIKKNLPFAIHINKFTVASENNKINTYYHLAYLPADSIHIRIPADSRYFSFTFDNPEDQDKNLPYYYRLGPEQTWVNLGSRREITFNKMTPGKYELQLTRSIKGHSLKDSIFQIPITILPAYYQTFWFKLLVLLLISGLVFLVMRLRQNQLDKERLLRTKIAGDLHDEIGSSLTRIWHEAQRLHNGAPISTKSEFPPAEEKKLQHIAETSQEAIAMLSDMVWSIDAQYDTLDELLIRMKTYVYQLQNDDEISVKMVTTNVSTEKKVTQIIRQNLFLLFKEAINNAIKYGDGAIIDIIIEIDVKIKMQITNSFDQMKKNTTSTIGGHGIANMQRRVKNMNGELCIERKENKFTLIIIV